MRVRQLSTGHWVNPDHVAAIYYSPWEKADLASVPHRVVIQLCGCPQVEIETSSAQEATALRDKLGGEINA